MFSEIFFVYLFNFSFQFLLSELLIIRNFIQNNLPTHAPNRDHLDVSKTRKKRHRTTISMPTRKSHFQIVIDTTRVSPRVLRWTLLMFSPFSGSRTSSVRRRANDCCFLDHGSTRSAVLRSLLCASRLQCVWCAVEVNVTPLKYTTGIILSWYYYLFREFKWVPTEVMPKYNNLFILRFASYDVYNIVT